MRHTVLLALLTLAASHSACAQKEATAKMSPTVFPIGIYHVGDYTLSMLKADNPEFNWDLDRAFAELAGRGFTFVHTMSEIDQKYLDAAARHNLSTMAELSTFVREKNLAGLEEKVKRLKDRPEVTVWGLVDEPNPDMLETVKSASEIVKRLDPSRPVMIDVCVPDWYDRFAPLCDVLATDPYPLLEKGDKPIEMVSGWLDRASATKKPVWLIPQCFAADGVWREPRPDELSCIVYQGLCAGVRGLAYYALTSGEAYSGRPPFKHWFLPGSPLLWDAVKEINAEVSSLAPVLLKGAPTDNVK